MFTSPHECGLCTHHISSLTDPGLVGCSRKGPHFLQKNPPTEIFGYGPARLKHIHTGHIIITATET